MKSRNAFTLVELLVVIAIIGILIGMLLPAVQMVREAARRIDCSNNCRQAGLAILNYESAHEHFPPGWSTGDPMDALAEPGWGWSAHILEYLEAGNLYDQIEFDIAIDDPIHQSTIENVLPFYLCTSDPGAEVVDLGEHVEHGGHALSFSPQSHSHETLFASRSNYSGCFGSTELEDSPLEGNGVFYANSEIDMSDIRDGTSNTIMIGERRSDFGAVSWVGMIPEVDEPFARIVGVADHAPNDSDGHFEDFRSFHPGGINVTRCDGSTHFISNSIDESAFQALGSRSGRD